VSGGARRISAIARRELAAYFLAPIAWVVGVLFLAVQGFSFWAVVEVLADPTRKAPMGAVLRTHFGGTFLYWSVLFLLVATIAMRLIAEDRRRGNWEALLTTPVEEGEAVIGKWLGALAFYALLWLPTLAFPIVVRVLAPPGAAPELAPVVTAYLGVVLSGAAFLAIALAASARTANQVIAAVAGFVALMAVLLLGQLPEIAPSLRDSAVLAYVDIRAHMDAFARGDVDLRWVVFYATIVAAALAVATAMAGVGRRRSAEVVSRATGAILVLVIAVLANVVAARHPNNWDVTAALVRAGEPGFEEVYDEIERVLRRMATAQSLLRVAPLDPVREPDRVARLATEAGVPAEVLRGVGAVVFVGGDGRTRVVELLDMAEIGRDELDVGAVLRLRAEAAFTSALLELTRLERPRLCATSGHGELPLTAQRGGVDANRLARRLQRAGLRVGDVGSVTGGVPASCRALLVLGPQRALSADDALAVDAYLRSGGRVLLAVDARAQRGRLAAHGLELVIGERGIRTPDAVVVDPSARVGIDYAWGALSSYAAHPVTAGFPHRRLTVWTLPRLVLAEGDDAVALVSSSTTGWAETDIDGLLGDAQVAPDGDDLVGGAPVAAAWQSGGGRLVVLGAAQPLSSAFDERGVGANVELAVAAVNWLVERATRIELGDKTPERVRLLLSASGHRGVFLLCVVLLPLLWAGLGGVLWWWRRRHG